MFETFTYSIFPAHSVVCGSAYGGVDHVVIRSDGLAVDYDAQRGSNAPGRYYRDGFDTSAPRHATDKEIDGSASVGSDTTYDRLFDDLGAELAGE